MFINAVSWAVSEGEGEFLEKIGQYLSKGALEEASPIKARFVGGLIDAKVLEAIKIVTAPALYINEFLVKTSFTPSKNTVFLPFCVASLRSGLLVLTVFVKFLLLPLLSPQKPIGLSCDIAGVVPSKL